MVKENKEQGKKCFIITPIGNQDSEIYRKITGVINSAIKPILFQHGFVDIKAAHEICVSGSINNQIIDRIISSDLIIANLTNNNPNVMYELCLRHVVAKPIIHICEKGTNLPFDIKGDRTIFYTDDMLGVEELKREIEKYIKEIDYSKEYRDNPIYNAQKINYLLKNEINEKSSIETELLRAILNEVTKDKEYNQNINIFNAEPNEKDKLLDEILEKNGIFLILKFAQVSTKLLRNIKEIMELNRFKQRNNLNKLEQVFFCEDITDLNKIFEELKNTSNEFGINISVRTIQTTLKSSIGSFIIDD